MSKWSIEILPEKIAYPVSFFFGLRVRFGVNRNQIKNFLDSDIFLKLKFSIFYVFFKR